MELERVYTRGLNLADAGLGSTLEDILNFKIAHTPLWSTRAAANEETSQLLLEAHLSFFRAGARTLLTATYQAAFNTFEREGYSREEALRVMSDAVFIAARARSLFCAKNERVKQSEIHIDFDGVFPPPYGPKAYSPTEANTTSFRDDWEGRERSIQALTEFHVERISAYTRLPETWDLIDCIAFETVPVGREITAIRRAVTLVADSLFARGKRMKPWWVTAVFPGGRCPETRSPGGNHFRAEEIAELMVQEEVDGEGRALAVPSGVGFNCVEVEYVPGLQQQFRTACARVYGEGHGWPWLVVKPNGASMDEKGWAVGVAACVGDARSQGWGGIIVGGCCKAGPGNIKELARLVEGQG